MTHILRVKQNGVWVEIPAVKGDTGEGVPSGGTTGQILVKSSNTDYDTEWATGDFLPTQTGQSGKFLTTDGTDASWATVDALPTQTGQSGKFLTTNGSAASWATVDALPSQTGQTGKFLTTDGTDASWSTLKTHNLLEFMWSDHILNDVSWLRADTFSWQSGEVYVSVFDHLLEDVGYVRYMVPDDGFNIKFYRSPADDTEMFAWSNQFSILYTENEFPENGDDFYYHNQVYGTVLLTGIEAGSGAVSSSTETIGSYTITFYRASDGHKVVLADQETTVANIYSEIGVAWYYILDMTNKRFKLPRTKWGFTGLRDGAGNLVWESLPNIKGGCGIIAEQPNDGAFYTQNTTGVGANKDFGDWTTKFDASRCSSTYQDNAPVQERATQMYLYFYVGDYTQTAIEQTAGLNAELFNDKVDIDSSWGFPSTTYDNLTLGANGASYTAPANGYYACRAHNNVSGHVEFVSNTLRICSNANSANSVIGCFIPVAKGETVYFYYSNTTISDFTFVYAQGSESEGQ